MEKKTTLDDVRKVSEKYDVDIEIVFSSRRGKMKICITNGYEIESFFGGWDNLDYDKIVVICKKFAECDKKRVQEINEHIKTIQLPSCLIPEPKLKTCSACFGRGYIDGCVDYCEGDEVCMVCDGKGKL